MLCVLCLSFVSFCWPWSCLSSDLTISVCPFGIFEFLLFHFNIYSFLILHAVFNSLILIGYLFLICRLTFRGVRNGRIRHGMDLMSHFQYSFPFSQFIHYSLSSVLGSFQTGRGAIAHCKLHIHY